MSYVAEMPSTHADPIILPGGDNRGFFEPIPTVLPTDISKSVNVKPFVGRDCLSMKQVLSNKFGRGQISDCQLKVSEILIT